MSTQSTNPATNPDAQPPRHSFRKSVGDQKAVTTNRFGHTVLNQRFHEDNLKPHEDIEFVDGAGSNTGSMVPKISILDSADKIYDSLVAGMGEKAVLEQLRSEPGCESGPENEQSDAEDELEMYEDVASESDFWTLADTLIHQASSKTNLIPLYQVPSQYTSKDQAKDQAKNQASNKEDEIGLLRITSGKESPQTIVTADLKSPQAENKTESAQISARQCVSKSCSELIYEGAKFCHVCGQKQISIFCPDCGFKFDGAEKFCPECGNER